MRELQSLCLDIAVHKVNTSDEGSEHVEVDLMANAGGNRLPSLPTYESNKLSCFGDSSSQSGSQLRSLDRYFLPKSGNR